jgi:hypothetical protein
MAATSGETPSGYIFHNQNPFKKRMWPFETYNGDERVRGGDNVLSVSTIFAKAETVK